MLIELGTNYECTRIGLLRSAQHRKACILNRAWSQTPVIKRTMLGDNGLIGKYGHVFTARELRR